MLDIKTVTVIGANGTMGSNVAAIFASFGEAKVYLVSRNIEDSKSAVKRAALSVKASVIENNLVACDYSQLDNCLSDSDFIFESVSEQFEIKKNIYTQMKNLKDSAIVATGTSGLSVDSLSQYLPEKIRTSFYGVHMFNPPYNMPLCELIPNSDAKVEVTAALEEYLSEKLLRKVVYSKDKPAFIGNRIGFYFINLAMLLAEKYKDEGGIDYIDAIFGGFTGRNMPPIVTADFVGLDVYEAIVSNLLNNTSDYQNSFYETPDYAQKLIAEGFLGRKSGQGLYRSVVIDGTKQRQVYDISAKIYRPVKKYSFDFADTMVNQIRCGDYIRAVSTLKNDNSIPAKICRELLLKYIVYGIYVASEVSNSVHSADIVMAEGFNWIPPLALLEAFGGKEAVCKMIESEFADDFSRIEYVRLLSLAESSKYDYRKFFKGKR